MTSTARGSKVTVTYHGSKGSKRSQNSIGKKHNNYMGEPVKFSFRIRALQFYAIVSMWMTAMIPIWCGMTFVLESIFLSHEETFNYEIEENTVISNVSTRFRVHQSVTPTFQLEKIDGVELITVPTTDGKVEGYGFPNISFSKTAVRVYLQSHNQTDANLNGTICSVTTQTRAMLLVARYGYLSATVQCEMANTKVLPLRAFFIHAARLLPKDPFGSNGVLNRFVSATTLHYLKTAAITNIKAYTQSSKNAQLDGFVVIDVAQYAKYATENPTSCKHAIGAFGAKQKFCPATCSKEEGVYFATWEDKVYSSFPFSHSLRSFHKVNTFLGDLVYSSDSCTAGRSYKVDPDRTIGIMNEPLLHVGCEEIYAEHWVILVIVILGVLFMIVAMLPYIISLGKATAKWSTDDVVARVDFASGMLNHPAIVFCLLVVSLREIAIIHALCIATAINGVSFVTIIFSLSHSLPVWILCFVLRHLFPRIRNSNILWRGYSYGMRFSASLVVGSYCVCYCLWLTMYSGNIRNLYLGGYPVVQPIFHLTSNDVYVDALRNIGMYKKWTSLGVYNMSGSSQSGISSMMFCWILLVFVFSIRIGVDKGSNVNHFKYKDILAEKGIDVGQGFFGNHADDYRVFNGIVFATINGQVNDGMFVYGNCLVNSYSAVGCIFRIPGVIRPVGYVEGCNIQELPENVDKYIGKAMKSPLILTNLA